MKHRGKITMRNRSLIEQIPDAVGISLSTKATVGAGVASIFSSVAQWNWTAIIASLVAILGLAMNYYFQRRRDKRESLESAARLAESQARQAEISARLKAIISNDRIEVSGDE